VLRDFIDRKDVPAISPAITQKMREHLFTYNICNSGVRCMNYLCFIEIRDRLYLVERVDQDAQKNEWKFCAVV
jgi:hypothetical protein